MDTEAAIAAASTRELTRSREDREQADAGIVRELHDPGWEQDWCVGRGLLQKIPPVPLARPYRLIEVKRG